MIDEIRRVVLVKRKALVEIDVVDAAAHKSPFAIFKLSDSQLIAFVIVAITDVRCVVAVED